MSMYLYCTYIVSIDKSKSHFTSVPSTYIQLKRKEEEKNHPERMIIKKSCVAEDGVKRLPSERKEQVVFPFLCTYLLPTHLPKPYLSAHLAT